MAKNTNKKSKTTEQKHVETKQKVHMQLVQNFVNGRVLTRAEKDQIYRSFRKRTKKKSNTRWRDLGIEPELLRLYFNGSMFNSTQEMLVEVGSFKPIMAKSESDTDVEIGFEVRVKSPMTLGRSHRLEVLRKQYKAILYIQHGRFMVE